ncbi:MAG: response regulator [Candidatus Brocadiia bacterium]
MGTDAEDISVLMVEDDASDARRLEGLLAECDLACSVESFELLWQGLERLKAGGIDIILLDLPEPEVGAMDPVERIREIAPGVPIVVLGTYESTAFVYASAITGAVAWLEKDELSADGLAQTIRSAVQQAH